MGKEEEYYKQQDIWNAKKLIADGYRIENARVQVVDLSMADHGCMTLKLVLNGGVWCTVFGGYALGNGYVGADSFRSTDTALVSIIQIMNVLECDTFNEMNGKYVRVATKGWGSSIKIIGNILKDQWFDYELFYKNLQ